MENIKLISFQVQMSANVAIAFAGGIAQDNFRFIVEKLFSIIYF